MHKSIIILYQWAYNSSVGESLTRCVERLAFNSSDMNPLSAESKASESCLE